MKKIFIWRRVMAEEIGQEESGQMFPQVITDKDVVRISGKGAEALKDAQALEVKDAFTLEYGMILLADIRMEIKQGELRRVFFTGPLNKHIKNINTLFKTILMPWESAEQITNGKLGEYQRTQRAEAEKARKETEQKELELKKKKEEEQKESGKAGTMELPLNMVVPSQTPARKLPPLPSARIMSDGKRIGTITERWTCEIQDIDLVPEGILREAARTQSGKATVWSVVNKKVQDGLRELPGIRIFEKDRVLT
jgi:hypothetical protein